MRIRRPFVPSWLLLVNIRGVYASSWAIYSDTACQKSLETVAGQNGYPDGVCTNLDEAAPAAFSSFAFITLDEDCSPTIYQPDTTADSCSGYAFEAQISTCYNTSWEWYSLDGCAKVTSTATIPVISTATASATTSPSPAGVSDGAIAGAVVGSVCGLGIIAAVSAYFFWFRPKQQEKARREALAAQIDAEAGGGGGGAGEKSAGGDKAHEMQQLPPELVSPTETAELSSAVVVEAPGDKGGVELPEESHAIELPGDHEYRSSESLQSRRSH